MAEIVRHLVDEMRLAGPIGLRVGEVFLAQPEKLFRRHVREHAGIARLVELAPLQFGHDVLDVGQLVGAFDLGMRRQNLFQQRRAGPRQADDENRIAAFRSPTGATFEKRARADFDLPVRVRFDDLRAILAFRALERVAAIVIGPGLRGVAAIFERLAQCKTEMIAVRQRCRRRKFFRAHALDFRVQEAVGLEIGEAPIGIAEIRPRLRGRAVGVNRFRKSPDRFQRVAQPEIDVRRLRHVLQESAIDGDRLLDARPARPQ